MHMMNENERQLVEDNIKLVYYVIHNYYPTFSLDEDLTQIGMIGLCKAAQTWNPEKSKFSGYAVACIKNDIRAELKKRIKQIEPMSIETKITDCDALTLENCLLSEDDVSMVDFNLFYNTLNDKDKQVLQYRKAGLVCREIGEITGVSHTAIDNRLRKMKRMWNERYGH